jgi:hypothetical protein
LISSPLPLISSPLPLISSPLPLISSPHIPTGQQLSLHIIDSHGSNSNSSFHETASNASSPNLSHHSDHRMHDRRMSSGMSSSGQSSPTPIPPTVHILAQRLGKNSLLVDEHSILSEQREEVYNGCSFLSENRSFHLLLTVLFRGTHSILSCLGTFFYEFRGRRTFILLNQRYGTLRGEREPPSSFLLNFVLTRKRASSCPSQDSISCSSSLKFTFFSSRASFSLLRRVIPWLLTSISFSGSFFSVALVSLYSMTIT